MTLALALLLVTPAIFVAGVFSRCCDDDEMSRAVSNATLSTGASRRYSHEHHKPHRVGRGMPGRSGVRMRQL